MPNPLRRPLLALALAAAVSGCATAAASSELPTGADKTVTVVDHVAPRHVLRPKPALGQRAARIALEAVGVPYHWGGSSPSSGFDCSGLVYWAYRQLGIDLPHSSYALASVGRRVARSRMRPGDLLFFYGFGHVGLYIGHGRMVHAPHTGARVQVVRLSRSAYGGALVSARRLARSS